MKTLVSILLVIGVIAFFLQTNSPIKLVMFFMQYVLPLIIGTLLIYSLLLLIKYKKEGI
ncbi:hypothetical protein GWK41_09915 [Persephonella atlantica]|uniref:Uncharacterized protein n=1 Tax=Persephonella atlantica TaxID=2699429 RepID=A0ABS1GKC1_9AQUI|nr:hypothetical protein [Persephonella atlantica]MBK3333379.1 hypothetical protein [Persephonella atlantica]